MGLYQFLSYVRNCVDNHFSIRKQAGLSYHRIREVIKYWFLLSWPSRVKDGILRADSISRYPGDKKTRSPTWLFAQRTRVIQTRFPVFKEHQEQTWTRVLPGCTVTWAGGTLARKQCENAWTLCRRQQSGYGKQRVRKVTIWIGSYGHGRLFFLGGYVKKVTCLCHNLKVICSLFVWEPLRYYTVSKNIDTFPLSLKCNNIYKCTERNNNIIYWNPAVEL